MPHKLVGTTVTFARPVVVRDGFTRQIEGKPAEHIPSEIKLVDTPATVIGVDPQFDAAGKPLDPRLHLAFLHPERTEALGGSGWREAFDRVMSVRPQQDPVCRDNDNVGRYRENDEVNLAPVMAPVKALPAQTKAPAMVPAKVAQTKSKAGTAAVEAKAEAATNSTT